MPEVEPKSMLMDVINNYHTERRNKRTSHRRLCFLLPSGHILQGKQPQGMASKGAAAAVWSPQPAGDQPLLHVLCNTLLLAVYGGCVGKEQ